MTNRSPISPGMPSSQVPLPIGTIVNSDSHVEYWCQVYGEGEVASPPVAEDYAFGRFVRVDLPANRSGESGAARVMVGVIYDTVLMNPAFGSLGPRLSTSDEQRAIFSPDYLTERTTLIKLLALGTIEAGRVRQGVPPLALALGALVSPLDEAEIRAFHYYADDGSPGGADPYLHMGYLPQLLGERGGLLPQAALVVLDHLHRLFPQHERLLSIVRRNLAWKLSVETAG